MRCPVFVAIIVYSSIYSVTSTPLIQPRDLSNDVRKNDVTGTRRISGLHHHHPSSLHDLDSFLNEELPEIIDLTGIDPCERAVCQDFELCVAQDKHLPICVDKQDIERFSGINSKGNCISCDYVKYDIQVCGSNGQTFKSECELKYKSCLIGINIRSICMGECPCPLDLIANSLEPDMMIDDVTKILGPPQALSVTSLEDDITSARVSVTWEPPSGYNEFLGTRRITEYTIHYSKLGTDEKWKMVRTPGSITSLSLTGLRNNALYYFRIQAHTSSVIGPLSDAVFHRTRHVGHEPSTTTLEENPVDNEVGDITDDEDASGDDER